MYNYIYNNRFYPASIIITADNKREANQILKEMECFRDFTFVERTKN